jgi:Holliday junction DNA helicase RuvA
MATQAMIFSVSTIAAWIEQGDTAALKRLPKIGARTAETIVAQLKGKVYNEAMLRDEGFSAAEKEDAASLSEMQQLAVAGLVRLGYKQAEAASWVEAVSGNGEGEPQDAEEIIRAVFAQRNEEIG